MRYAIYGPFEVPRQKNGLVTRSAESRNTFWNKVEETEEGLSEACGCYVFVVRGKPWYIGKAEKQMFKQECFQHQKLTHFDDAVRTITGIPYLYFITKMTPQDWFALPSKNGHRDISELENILIGMGLSRNSEIRNIKGTKMLREMNVPGIVNSMPGQSNAHAVQGIKKVFDL
jgi:hypothetical protein